MRGKYKKLREWVAAGLLSEDQALSIQTYENAHKAGRFGRGLVGLSIFAILVGVLSIVASNWAEIPGGVKIGAHLLLNLLIGGAALYAARQNKDIWREGLTLAFFGLSLTLIALVGQVFQLNGETANALLLWMGITLPFMLIFAASYLSVVPWMAAFLTTIFFALLHYGEGWQDYWQGVILTSMCILLPLFMMALGVMSAFKTWKPVWASVFLKTGLVLMAISATVSAIVLGFDRYDMVSSDMREEFYSILNTQRFVCVLGFVAIALHAYHHKFYIHDAHLKHGAIFAAVSLLVVSLPLAIVSFYNTIFSALAFILYWMFIGWTGQQLDQSRLISWAIILIAIRIFIVYLELFGSLMQTGFGLIIGGAVMLGLLWMARKMNKRFAVKVDG
jgi:uncharacterized membrane protein